MSHLPPPRQASAQNPPHLVIFTFMPPRHSQCPEHFETRPLAVSRKAASCVETSKSWGLVLLSWWLQLEAGRQTQLAAKRKMFHMLSVAGSTTAGHC
jgi:hypothetical protein